MIKSIDVNCDLGEGFEYDEAIMHYISSANIACGYHAGNAATIRSTIDLCLKHKVFIGAHPSFEDRPNFGRTEMNLSEDEIYNLILKQIQILDLTARDAGTRLHHVKPHGALYNMATHHKGIASAIVKAIKDFDDRLILFGLSASHLILEAEKAGLAAYNEVFADRTYLDDGRLTRRSQPDALITDLHQMIDQVMKIVTEGKVISINEKEIPIHADTICIHGDGPFALVFAEALYHTMQMEGIQIEKSLC